MNTNGFSIFAHFGGCPTSMHALTCITMPRALVCHDQKGFKIAGASILGQNPGGKSW